VSDAGRETRVEENTTSREEYARRLLAAYRSTPGTTGYVRREDRRLAGRLYEKGVSVETVENALVLAAARRLFRPPDAARLATIRSLHYFLPVIEEVAELTVGQDYFQYLCGKIERFLKNPKGD
jgi:hypothetical protein